MHAMYSRKPMRSNEQKAVLATNTEIRNPLKMKKLTSISPNLTFITELKFKGEKSERLSFELVKPIQ